MNLSAAVLAVFTLFTVSVSAKEIPVDAGIDTFLAAYNTAVDGDVLILETGNYINTAGALEIDKSIEIRPIDRSYAPNVQFELSFTGESSVVVLRNFKGSTCRVSNIERFVAIENSCSQIIDGVTDAIIIRSSISTFANITNGYILGSYVTCGSWSATNLYVVGNKIICSIPYGSTPQKKLNATSLFFIGNTFDAVFDDLPASYAYNSYIDGTLLGLTAQNIHVRNNIFKFSFVSLGSNNYSYKSNGAFLNISANSTAVREVINNTFILDNPKPNGTKPPFVSISGPTYFYNNICTGSDVASLYSDTANGFGEYNACNPGLDSVTGDLALNTDYSLGEGSVAIDAGKPDLRFNDVDGSRNDLGAFGGSFSIDQFNRQREAGNLEPFVYPLFVTDGSTTAGSVAVEVISAARLP